MTKFFIHFILTSMIFPLAYAQNNIGSGIRNDAFDNCERNGGSIVFDGEFSKTINGEKHTCYKNAQCAESKNDSGYIKVAENISNNCVSESQLNKYKQDLFLGKEDCGKGCSGEKVDIGGGYVTSIHSGHICYKEYKNFIEARNKFFTKGKGGGFLFFKRSRQKNYRHKKKKLQECLFAYSGTSCVKTKSSSCFQNIPGISVEGDSEIVFHEGHTNCSVSGNCLPNSRTDEILSDYYDDECVDCNNRKKKREKERSSSGFWNGGFAGLMTGAGIAANGLFSYLGVKSGHDACKTSYASYADSINSLNTGIGTENANVRSPGNLPLLDYRNPRTPNCNGYAMNSFAGMTGAFSGNTFGYGAGFNPMFPQSYQGYGLGLNMYNPYGGMGQMYGGGNIGVQLPSVQIGMPSWQTGGYYPQGGAGWYAGANGHMPYGGQYGGVGMGPNSYGGPYSGAGAFGQGAYGYGQGGFGQGQFGAGMSQRNMINPQAGFFQSQLQQNARMRDAGYYQQRAFGNGYGSPYQQPGFPPFR